MPAGRESVSRGAAGRARSRAPKRRRITARLRGQADEVRTRLESEYPDAVCALEHRNAYELLVATILSAQCTDERVNMVTPEVFRRWPTPSDLAAADPEELEEVVRSTGFFRSKAKNLLGMARDVDERFGGEVPVDRDELTSLAGVGRKTANVVRSVAFAEPGLPVDTHVKRLSNRLGLTKQSDPVKIEFELMPLFPPEAWGDLSLRLIQHGRRVCDARKPDCAHCVLEDICPSSRL